MENMGRRTMRHTNTTTTTLTTTHPYRPSIPPIKLCFSKAISSNSLQLAPLHCTHPLSQPVSHKHGQHITPSLPVSTAPSTPDQKSSPTCATRPPANCYSTESPPRPPCTPPKSPGNTPTAACYLVTAPLSPQIMLNRVRQRLDRNRHRHLVAPTQRSERAVPLDRHRRIHARQQIAQQLGVADPQAARRGVHLHQHLLLDDRVLLSRSDSATLRSR